MYEWIQLVVGIVSAVFLSALVIYNFRVIHSRVDSKMDKSACLAQHEAIKKDFARGEKSFDGLRKEIKELAKAQGTTNTLLGRLDERIVQYMQQARPHAVALSPAVKQPETEL